MTSTRPRITPASRAAAAAVGDHRAQLVHHARRPPLRPRLRPSRASAARCRFRGSATARCRPAAPRHRRIAACTRRWRSGERPANRTFFSSCGSGVNTRHTSLAGRPCSTSTASTCSAASSPSPVVAKSDRIRWPDCSPPTFMPMARASARPHSGRRPGCGAAPGPARPDSRSSPRLDITVATMPPPRSRPGLRQERAISARIWSPSISSPVLVGHASPGRHRHPARCPDRRRAPAPARTATPAPVEPQPRLMLKPSGARRRGMTVAPSSHSTVGATL